MGATVLVVDDEPQLVRTVSIGVRARDGVVHTACTAGGALELAVRHRPDAVVLGLRLPDMDGAEVVARLRGWSRAPIIGLSAGPSSDDRVRALQAGADDFVTKPFEVQELLVRLRAALRGPGPGAPVLDLGGLVVDLPRAQVRRAGAVIPLAPVEWRLLEVLAREHGRMVPCSRLLRQVWGPDHADDLDYLRLYVAQLRRTLEPVPSRPVHLLTEPGMGYRLQGPADAQSRGT